jgi:protein O-GlcNAc transferase
VNLGQTLRSWGRADEAEKAFQEAVHVIPNSPLALILLSVARKEICVWEQLTERRHEVRSTVEKQIRVDKEFPALLPYDALMMPYDPIWRLEVATAHSKQWSELKKTPTSRIRHRGDPLVVGYFSYDFRKHAMGFLTRGFLHHHNRDRVRPIAYVLSFRENKVFIFYIHSPLRIYTGTVTDQTTVVNRESVSCVLWMV